jgi:hypothetical protein
MDEDYGAYDGGEQFGDAEPMEEDQVNVASPTLRALRGRLQRTESRFQGGRDRACCHMRRSL